MKSGLSAVNSENDKQCDGDRARLKRKGELTMKSLTRKMKTMSSGRRKKIEDRAAGLIAEEMTLQELRQARKLTQVRMAKVLGISQVAFSVWKCAAIFCFPHYGRASRRWAATCL